MQPCAVVGAAAGVCMCVAFLFTPMLRVFMVLAVLVVVVVDLLLTDSLFVPFRIPSPCTACMSWMQDISCVAHGVTCRCCAVMWLKRGGNGL